MAISNIAAKSAFLTSVSTIYTAQDALAGSASKTQEPLPKSPRKPTIDTVSISRQAQALLANSKAYSPAEEATESGTERSVEKTKRQK